MFDYSEIFELIDKNFILDELDCVAEQNLEIFELAIKETIGTLEKKHNCIAENEISSKILTLTKQLDEQEKNTNQYSVIFCPTINHKVTTG